MGGNLFKKRTINFGALGIGGLDEQFDAIFRRAFASRVFPPSIVQRLGIQHVKVRHEAGALIRLMCRKQGNAG